ncbi:hypothetical protein [Streptomyces sp. NPDC003730]
MATKKTNGSFVRPLHRLHPDEPGRGLRPADAAAHERRAGRGVPAVPTV